MTTAAVNERLALFLNEAKPWEKKATSIPGVFLLKLPTFKGTAPSLAIEVNPVNAATRSAINRRGVIIRSGSELEEIIKLISNPKVSQLAKSIDQVNPAKESTTAKSGNDIFEIRILDNKIKSFDYFHIIFSKGFIQEYSYGCLTK